MGTSVMQRDANARNMPGGLVLPLPSPLLASLPPEYQGKPYQWFTQTLDILATVQNVAKSGSFQVDQNHAFATWWGAVKLRSADNLTNKDGDPVLLSMTDNANNNYTPNQSTVDIENIFGSAKQPSIFPEPLFIDKNGTFTITATVLSAASLNIRFAFPGVLIDLRG